MKIKELSGRNASYVTMSAKVAYVLQQKGLQYFAGQLVDFWKKGLLVYDPAKIATNYVVGENGTEHHNFNHHDCYAQKISKISS